MAGASPHLEVEVGVHHLEVEEDRLMAMEVRMVDQQLLHYFHHCPVASQHEILSLSLSPQMLQQFCYWSQPFLAVSQVAVVQMNFLWANLSWAFHHSNFLQCSFHQVCPLHSYWQILCLKP